MLKILHFSYSVWILNDDTFFEITGLLYNVFTFIWINLALKTTPSKYTTIKQRRIDVVTTATS